MFLYNDIEGSNILKIEKIYAFRIHVCERKGENAVKKQIELNKKTFQRPLNNPKSTCYNKLYRYKAGGINDD